MLPLLTDPVFVASAIIVALAVAAVRIRRRIARNRMRWLSIERYRAMTEEKKDAGSQPLARPEPRQPLELHREI